MHPNPAFRGAERTTNIAFAQKRSFGVLAVNGADGPLLSHIPFQLSQDGTALEAHLVRSNPIVRALTSPQPGVIAVSGGDAYVSPDWYGVDDQVPTWNYIAVHIRGTLRLLEQGELHGVLDRLSAGMEGRLADKTPWTSTKMDQHVYTRMQRQIVPIAMDVSAIDGTWKLSQNKPEPARLGAAAGVETAGMGQDTASIAALMKS
ncbi:MAG: FMN-binding negative transcriptional regulator [Pseudomonadota bacterium]